MSSVIIPTRFQWRRDTAANWTANNPTPLAGEPCLETDTGKVKIGDGSTAWTSLDYYGIYHNGATPSDGDVLTFDSSLGVYKPFPASGGSSSTDPTTSIIDPAHDFLGKPPTSVASEAGASYPWCAVTIGTLCSISSIDGEANAPGIWRMRLGNSGANHVVMAHGTSPCVKMGSGVTTLPFRFRVSDLSDATNRYTVILGWGDLWTGSFPNGLALWYSDNINSGALTLRATTSGVSTEDVSSVTLTADAWVTGYLQVNGAGTQVDMYVAGALVASVASGLPSVALRPGAALFRNAGSTARDLDLDYLGPPNVTFTTPR